MFEMDFQNIIAFGIIFAVHIWFAQCDLSPQKRQAQEPTCPDEWTLFGDSCYFYSGASGSAGYKTWDAAQGACFADGGQLVEIESAAEKTFLTELRKNVSSFPIPAWIGLHDIEKEGTHIWVSTGVVATYTNWGIDEPNDNDGGACIQMYPTGLWGDISCTFKRTYFCERLVNAVCPTGWTFFRGGCYKYRETKKTWDNAETACIGDGGHLVDVTSAAENTFLVNLMHESTKLVAWIGLDGRENGNYAWVSSGEVADFTNWGVGEPTGQTCVQMYDTGLWNDMSCTFTRDSICERPVKETCREGWKLFNRRCYKYSATKASWDSAQTACSGSVGGGGLAEITSAAVNTFLSNLRQDPVADAWIGLIRVGGDFIWKPSGNDATYLNWASGEPNNHQTSENCVEMYQDGKWNDHSCTNSRNYFCEQLPNITPW